MAEEKKEETKNYAFFQHKECEYFPCHKTNHPEDFNCLFCYCPLYCLGDSCGGKFTYTEKGYKSCMDCMVPHGTHGYEYVISRYKDVAEVAKQNRKKS